MFQQIADHLVYQLLGLSAETRMGQAAHFFVYDSLKILFLLYVMIFVIGVLRTFLPQNKVRSWMGRRGLSGHLFASVFGAVTPFCSCSSIPLFLSFLKTGIPLGVSFSFLITSPLVNEYLVVLMLGFFGWKITAVYVACGMLVGMVSGAVLGRMNLERHLVEDMVPGAGDADEAAQMRTFAQRLRFGWQEALSIVRKIWVWVLVGVAIGSVIHNYVPQDMVQALIKATGIFSVPIATLLGVPMYGSCASIVPIAVVLFQKGIPLGTAMAFMMAVAALSLPEAVMLRRAMRLPLILTFFGITALAIIVTGYLFNVLQPILAM